MNEPKIPAEDGHSQPQSEQDNQATSSNPVTTDSGASESSQKQESSPHSKPCSICHRPRNVLVRCQIDESRKWNFVCTAKCWQEVSGGKEDGDKDHPLYRYGGMWKNKHEYVSAKIKGKAKNDNKDYWNGTPGPHRGPAWKSKRTKSKKDQGKGKVAIGKDDGGSDVEVSELSDEDGYGHERKDDLSHVQVKDLDGR
ncbi:hypothetical protein EG329_008142 [Mollisiaceae sp. DMI_Dod_QoI]|nr:hypothetical protein EG329_008142 [Helotiales sp. DMI_Dod_QoI]